ncbi:MAG: hypothetical protein PVJ02_11360 [Gemmatimonadota bacterium]|jgi:hypothetical protein
MRSLAAGIIGAAALAAGILLVRQVKQDPDARPRVTPAGESQPAMISLDRIRAQGY